MTLFADLVLALVHHPASLANAVRYDGVAIALVGAILSVPDLRSWAAEWLRRARTSIARRLSWLVSTVRRFWQRVSGKRPGSVLVPLAGTSSSSFGSGASATVTVNLEQRIEYLEQRVTQISGELNAKLSHEAEIRDQEDKKILREVRTLERNTTSTSLWALPLIATGIVLTGLAPEIGSRSYLAWLVIGIASAGAIGISLWTLGRRRSEAGSLWRPASSCA